MNRRSLMLAAALTSITIVGGLVVWKELSPASPRVAAESSPLQYTKAPPTAVPGTPAPTTAAPTAAAPAIAAASALLAAYQCADCPAAAAAENPFVADSVAEALWMQQNAFPTPSQRAWTDAASLADVEARALREGGDVWLLELVRKRCAVGDARLCALDELGRARLLAFDGRIYANYVLAESNARLAQAEEGSVPLAVSFWARRSAPKELFTAALRGDGKAMNHLAVLMEQMDRARRPWSANDLRRAFSSAISSQEVYAAHAAATGQVPRQWPLRPSRSHDEAVRMMIEWEARTRAAHAAGPPGR